MREQLTRLLRLCIGEEKGVLASGKGEGGECMLACFQGENCQGARDREEHKKREKGGRRSGGSVLGDTSWRGERGVVSGEGKGEKKKVIWGGFQGRTSLSERRAEV